MRIHAIKATRVSVGVLNSLAPSDYSIMNENMATCPNNAVQSNMTSMPNFRTVSKNTDIHKSIIKVDVMKQHLYWILLDIILDKVSV